MNSYSSGFSIGIVTTTEQYSLVRSYKVMSNCCDIYDAKQKHLGCKKVRGQSEATLQTGMQA